MINPTKMRNYGLLALRLGAGLIFMLHGYGKLFGDAPGMAMFTKMVAGIGFPWPAVFAYAAALSEFVGGLALILGFYTSVAALFTGVVMLVAFTAVKKLSLPSGDPDLALLAMSLGLMLTGGGKYALADFKECEDNGKKA